MRNYLDEQMRRMQHRHQKRIGDKPIGLRAVKSPDIDTWENPAKSQREIILTATTDDIDSDREVVIPGGVDMMYFNVNKAIFVDHMYDQAHRVGTLRWTRPYPSVSAISGWEVRCSILGGLSNPLADDTWTIINEPGGAMGASIGFLALDYGAPDKTEKTMYPGAESVVRRAEVFETSLTSLPANVRCRVLGAELVMDPDDLEPQYQQAAATIQRLAVKGRIRAESAIAFGVDPEPKRRRVYMLD